MMRGIEQHILYSIDKSEIVVGDAYAIRFNNYEDGDTAGPCAIGICIEVNDDYALFGFRSIVDHNQMANIFIYADDIAAGRHTIMGRYSFPTEDLTEGIGTIPG